MIPSCIEPCLYKMTKADVAASAVAARKFCILNSLGTLNAALYLCNKLQSHSACLKESNKILQIWKHASVGVGEQRTSFAELFLKVSITRGPH